MKKLLFCTAIAALALPVAAMAEGDLSRANVQKVALEMGTDDDGNMYFKPSHLEFETGQAYALVMTNVDPIKHELEAHEFVEKIFTRKVEIETADGELVAEIKGNVTEIEVGPNQTVEWYFVPVQDGAELDMVCAIEGHFEAGMFGTISLR